MREHRRAVLARWRELRGALAAETGLRGRGPAWSALFAGLGLGLALALGRRHRRRPRRAGGGAR